MNGRRKKALKAMFRRVHGRDPRTGVAVVDRYEPHRMSNGILYDPHAYEFHGMRYDQLKHVIVETSEWRTLKRAFKASSFVIGLRS